MKFAGVLLDYNGTLIFDADINEWAWRQTINELSQGALDFDEVYAEYRSRRNEVFVAKAFEMLGKEVDEKTIKYWATRKETVYYHQYSREHQRNQLSPGAAELLDYLKGNRIPYNLATASLKENVDFYFDFVGIRKWFDIDVVAYDDGSFPDKTSMYKASAERIGVNIEDCLIIEDSANSIREAMRAGCRNFVAIRKPDTPSIPEILQVVDDLREFDYDLLK